MSHTHTHTQDIYKWESASMFKSTMTDTLNKSITPSKG